MKTIKNAIFILTLLCISMIRADTVTIAIFASNSGHNLDNYLKSLEQQTWPADQTYLYIRTWNSDDQTAEKLHHWIESLKERYLEVHFDDTAADDQEIRSMKQNSIHWAEERGSHYFTAESNNFLKPKVIENLVEAKLPIIAPYLISKTRYSNFHAAVDLNGYYQETPLYDEILYQRIKGFIEVPVVNSAYLIRHEVLDKMTYDDQTNRDEYVIFSEHARKQNISQFLDNRDGCGIISTASEASDFQSDEWYHTLLKQIFE